MNRLLLAVRYAAAMGLAAVVIGVIGALFLDTLKLADVARVALVEAATKQSVPGWLAATIAGLAGAAVAAWLTDRYAQDAPQSSEAHAEENESPTPALNTLAVNFGGTGLAVGAGLALGPERPAIQMGGAVGRLVSRLFRLNAQDRDLLLAATGGAGVATMFNSPLGCAAYTVETVLKRVDLKISLTTLGVGALAVAVTRLLTGRDVNFVVEEFQSVPFEHLLLYLVLGCMIAVFAYFHVRLIMGLARFLHRANIPRAVRGAVIGAAIGLLGWYSPDLVGVGDSLTQGVLDGRFALSTMAFLFLVRFFLGPVSLAGGTPGGYFTPVLLLGGLAGAMYGLLMSAWLPFAIASPTTFALVGMAVALAAVANAPFTGVLLVMETTGAFALSLPMIIAVIGASIVLHALRTPTLGTGLRIALSTPGRQRHPQSRKP